MTSLKCEEKKGRVVSVIFSNSPYALIAHSGQRRTPRPVSDSVWKTVSCIWCDVKVHQPLHKQWLYRHMLQCHDRVHPPEQGNASSHVGEWLKSRSVRQRKYSHLIRKGGRSINFSFYKEDHHLSDKEGSVQEYIYVELYTQFDWFLLMIYWRTEHRWRHHQPHVAFALYCVCAAKDHRWRQNVVRTSVTHSASWFFFVLTTSWRHLWSIT